MVHVGDVATGLGTGSLAADFCGDAIAFPQYPFAAASVRFEPVLPACVIRDVAPTACPPEVRTTAGETLFVARESGADLTAFAERNAIPVRDRYSVWSDLLEPFLDADFTAEERVLTRDRLRAHGVCGDEIADARQRVRRMMLTYNSVNSECAELGLAHLLFAARLWHAPNRFLRRRLDPAEFYWWTMELADRPEGLDA